jgi:pimeloyl-ACP methyl ester carboxylesterase
MQLAAKWRTSWTVYPDGFDQRWIQSIRVGNEWVDVVRIGRGDPVVLVPGLAGGWKLLFPLARLLARDFDVIVPSLRGDSSSWGELEGHASQVCDVSEYGGDLAFLIDHLGLESPTVVGVSYGGAVALEYASQFPDQLGALVVSGVEARFHRTIGSKIARFALERYPLPNDNPFINQFFHLLYGAKPEPGPLVDFVVDRIWETDQSVMAQRLAQLESFDVSDRLAKIHVPTLVLGGIRDVIVPHARQRSLAEEVPGARFAAIEEAGHLAFLTHRTQFARLVRRHLRRINAAV